MSHVHFCQEEFTVIDDWNIKICGLANKLIIYDSYHSSQKEEAPFECPRDL